MDNLKESTALADQTLEMVDALSIVERIKQNSIKVASAFLLDGNQKNLRTKWSWKYEIDKNKVFSNSSGRVYFIVLTEPNGTTKISKIGGSMCKGGIRATINGYASAKSAKPSLRTFGVCQKIEDWLNENVKVEVYMKIALTIKMKIDGIFSTEEKDISTFKEMEKMCLDDYKYIIGEYPEMNYQERNEKWPKTIDDKWTIYLAEHKAK